jgi:hypothetical protein
MKFGSHRTRNNAAAQKLAASLTSSSSREVEWKKKHIKKDFRAQRPIKFRLDHLSVSLSREHKSAAASPLFLTHKIGREVDGACTHRLIPKRRKCQ